MRASLRLRLRPAALAAVALAAALAAPAPSALSEGAAGDAPVAPAAPTPDAFLAKCRYVPEPCTFEVDAARPLGDRIVYETIRFPSPVRSVDPERNDVVRAKLFRTKAPEPAAVVFLGGWRRDPLTPTLAARLADTGVQALLVELPFQGDRTPKGRQSGELTLSADLDQNEATFVQAAQDVARAVEWLVRERKVDPERVGIFGTSLGGYVTAGLYGLDGRFACAVVQLAGSDVASVLFNGNWLTQRIRDELVAKGLDEATVRERMRPLDPATWARPARKDGLLLIASEKDEIVPVSTVRALAAAWGGARTIEIPGAGHLSGNEIAAKFPDAAEHILRALKVEPRARDDGTDTAPPAPAAPSPPSTTPPAPAPPGR